MQAGSRGNPPADWQLPDGVSRGLWDYLHSEEVAAGYDAYSGDSALAREDIDFVTEHCPADGLLLDMGCGTGRLLAAWRGRAVGVDLSHEMLRVAAAKVPGAALVRLNLTEMAAFPSGTFAAAACLFSTLGMVSGAGNRLRIVGEAARVLRPGGRLVLHAHNLWHNLRDRGGRAWLLRGGWRTGDRPMPPHQGVAGLSLHHFTRGEVCSLVEAAGLRVREVRRVGAEGRARWWLPAYGFLVAGEKV
jgi:SAM-dependent methyltransferase